MLNWTGICTGLVYWTGMASPLHTTHHSPTQDGWVSSKIKNGVAVSPENSVAVSPEYRKGILAWKTCGFEIDANPFILYMYTTSVVL